MSTLPNGYDQNQNTSISSKVNKSGDTMTGDLAMGSNKVTSTADPVNPEDLSRKSYVDGGDALKVAKAGDTMTGDLAMGSNKVTSSAAPTVGSDLTNKTYVDGAAGGVKPTAPPAFDANLLNVQFPNAIGLQGAGVSTNENLARDFAFDGVKLLGTEPGLWYKSIYLLVPHPLSSGVQGSNGTVNRSTQLICRYKTVDGTQIVYAHYIRTATGTDTTSSGLIASTAADTVSNAGQANITIRFYGGISSITAGGNVSFTEPLANRLFRLKADDIDDTETFVVGFDNIISWDTYTGTLPLGTAPNVKVNASGVTFEGTGQGSSGGANICITNGPKNEMFFQWPTGTAGSGITFAWNNLTSTWYGKDFLIKTKIENSASPNGNIRYNIGSATNISFLKLSENNNPADTSEWLQSDVESRLILARISGSSTAPITSFTIPVRLTDNRLALYNPSISGYTSYTVAVVGGYTRLPVSVGLLDPINGGTGRSTLTSGRVLVGNDAGAVDITKVAPTGDFVGTTDTQSLTNKTIDASSNTVTNVSLTTGVTGVLPVANGGTNVTSYTAGDLLVAGGLTTLDKLSTVTPSVGSVQLLKSLSAGVSPQYGTVNLNELFDVTTSTLRDGDILRQFAGEWVNRRPNDGQIKVNSFNTNVGNDNLITFTNLTTEQDVTYRITGQTTTALNQSAFPTTSIPLNYEGVFTNLGTVGVDGDFYRLGATAADDRWIQNQVLGQICEYRVEGSYSNKTASNSGRIQIRIYNPLSSFSFEVSVPLAQGLTSDDFGVTLVTINDSANLLTPLGTGGGYKIGISSTTSLDVTIQSVVRIDRSYSDRS